MEEGFEPAEEEAVRIFLEGGVPTSCWELRNRHWKTLWDRVSGVHEVHMGNTWSITGLFLVNGLLGPILWSVHFDKALTGKDANWSIPVPAVWLQQQDGRASMRRGTWATSFSKLPYFREMQVGEISITWPNRLFCSQAKEWTTIFFPRKNTIRIGSLLRLPCTNPIHVPTKMCFVTWWSKYVAFLGFLMIFLVFLVEALYVGTLEKKRTEVEALEMMVAPKPPGSPRQSHCPCWKGWWVERPHTTKKILGMKHKSKLTTLRYCWSKCDQTLTREIIRLSFLEYTETIVSLWWWFQRFYMLTLIPFYETLFYLVASFDHHPWRD